VSAFREVITASARVVRDFERGGMLWHALWPPLVALVGWAIVAWFTWKPLAAWLLGVLPHWPWLNWLGPWLVYFVLALVFAPLIYVTAVLLVSVVVLPHLMTIVARRDYPDLVRRGSMEAVFWGSLWNTVTASVIFIAGWLITLPLLLVPGGLLVLPVCWSAWLNQRTFRYDVLAEHATDEERNTLIARSGSRFYLTGFVAALAAHVPILNLLAPAFGALLFAHVGLAALRQMRAA
jgi:hypothetical protein